MAKCQRCKANSAPLTGDSRIGRFAEDPKWRTLSTWGLKAWDALPAKSSCAPGTPLDLSGRDARCIEIFAGTGRVTQSWLDTGALADTPIELFSDPLSHKGPRQEHDAEVQRALLNKARSTHASRPTHCFIEFPCGSFCDWQLHNGGTRSYIDPVGHPDGPLCERDGTTLASFAASLYTAAANSGDIVVAENPAPSGRYPSAFDFPCWQKVLRRRDTIVVPIWTCANMAAVRSTRLTSAIASAPGSSLTTQPCPPFHADAPRITSTRPCVALDRGLVSFPVH